MANSRRWRRCSGWRPCRVGFQPRAVQLQPLEGALRRLTRLMDRCDTPMLLCQAIPMGLNAYTPFHRASSAWYDEATVGQNRQQKADGVALTQAGDKTKRFWRHPATVMCRERCESAHAEMATAAIEPLQDIYRSGSTSVARVGPS